MSATSFVDANLVPGALQNHCRKSLLNSLEPPQGVPKTLPPDTVASRDRQATSNTARDGACLATPDRPVATVRLGRRVPKCQPRAVNARWRARAHLDVWGFPLSLNFGNVLWARELFPFAADPESALPGV